MKQIDYNERYRGRMSAVIFDPDVIKETDRLRGDIPRSRYINEALREYNSRIAIIKAKIDEAEKDFQNQKSKNEELVFKQEINQNVKNARVRKVNK